MWNFVHFKPLFHRVLLIFSSWDQYCSKNVFPRPKVKSKSKWKKKKPSVPEVGLLESIGDSYLPFLAPSPFPGLQLCTTFSVHLWIKTNKCSTFKTYVYLTHFEVGSLNTWCGLGNFLHFLKSVWGLSKSFNPSSIVKQTCAALGRIKISGKISKGRWYKIVFTILSFCKSWETFPQWYFY